MYMHIKANISELNSYMSKAKATFTPNIKHTIRLYEDRQIATFKTRTNTVLYFVNLVALVNGRTEKEYSRVVATHENTTPATRQDRQRHREEARRRRHSRSGTARLFEA